MSLPPPNPRTAEAPVLGASTEEYADAGARAIDLSDRPVADSLREVMASSPRLTQQSAPPLPPPAPAFANRHWTLAIFGLLHLGFAFVAAGETTWHLVTGGMDALAQDLAERARLLVRNSEWVLWELMIGLGLIFARRWARSLAAASFSLMVIWAGQSTIALAVNDPDPRAPLSAFDPTPAWEFMAMLVVIGLLGHAAAHALNHRNVRLTCEAAQPQPDWTDRRSPAELLLFLMLIEFATVWVAHATHHPLPVWGHWRDEWSAVGWGGSAALAAVAAILVMAGRSAGTILAALVVVVVASSVAFTATRQPAFEFVELWGDWDFKRPGGLAFVAAQTLVVLIVAWAALRSQRIRQPLSPTTHDA